jgi:hypothetical protein
MSVETRGLSAEDHIIIAEAVDLACEQSIHDGAHIERVYGEGVIVARRTGEYIFATLRSMDVIPEDGIDAESFETALRNVIDGADPVCAID